MARYFFGSSAMTRASLSLIVGLACLIVVAMGGSIASQAQPPPPPPTEFAPATFEIVKIDPEPVAPNSSFAIVVRIRNRVDRDLRIVISHNTQAIPASLTVDLRPREERIVEVPARLVAAGAREVEISASWQTGETYRYVRRNGVIEIRYRYKSLGSDSALVRVQNAAATPTFVDLGPTKTGPGGSSFSGVVQAIVGTNNMLFAVPKTAGVWRSINGAAWQHLPRSPPRAFSIAIDPGNRTHLVVGERADDNDNPRLGRSGLWESSDNGETWFYTFDPTPEADAQQISAVAFSRSTSTLFILTTNGVARRPRSQTASPFDGTFTYGVPGPNCTGVTTLAGMTALTVSETRVWARSRTHVFWSDDDGRTWACRAFPSTVDIPGTPTNFDNVIPDFNTASVGGNDNVAIGAFDDLAFVIFSATHIVPRTDPRALEDIRCNPSHPKNDPSFNQCVFVRSPILIFDPSKTGAAAWTAQDTADGDGRGLNGRRFVKAVTINALNCPAYADQTIGSGRQIIYSAAQSIQQAKSRGPDGRIVWDRVQSAFGTPNGDRINVHSDFWDFHLPEDFCPSVKPKAFLATDGGIHVGEPAEATPWIAAFSWRLRSEGLHVSTAQNLLVVESSTVPPPTPGEPVIPIRHMAYPTQDNESWWREENGDWRDVGAGGDVNFVAGDIAQPAAVLWRNHSIAKLVTPNGAETSITLNFSQQFDGPSRIQAIQSLATEHQPDGTLDMVMLVRLPLMKKVGDNLVTIADPPGGTGSGSRLALIRNREFNEKPNGVVDGYDGWTIELDELPADTLRFWSSGGHTSTRYYIYSGAGSATCPNGLQTPRFNPATRLLEWRCLARDLEPVIEDPAYGPSNDFVGQHGPVFVNPFNPDILIIASTSPHGGILRLTTDAGDHFCDLPALTALTTESGRYAVTGVFGPYPAFNNIGSRFHGYPFSVPSDIGFYRHAPTALVVASPYTGLYAGQLSSAGQNRPNCTDPGFSEPVWRDLSPFMPNSSPYVSSVTYLGTGAAVVSTAGRGIYAISNIRAALPATFFITSSLAHSLDTIALLRKGDGSPFPWGRVRMTVRETATRNVLVNKVVVRGGGGGEVLLPTQIPAGNYIIDLQFLGDGSSSPSRAKFQLQIGP